MNSRHERIRSGLRRAAGAAALSATSISLLAGVASAQTTVTPDERGDISHGADIRRVHVVNEDRVRVKVVHRDLVADYRSGSSLSVFLDTKPSRKGPEFVFLGGTFEGADYALVRAEGWKAASRTAVPMQCGYDMELDFADDTATIRMDRDCLGNPGPVRVEVKTGGELVPEGQEPTTEVDWLGEPRKFAPWVKRG